eukprot:Gb_35076 [translate_table: standard]
MAGTLSRFGIFPGAGLLSGNGTNLDSRISKPVTKMMGNMRAQCLEMQSYSGLWRETLKTPLEDLHASLVCLPSSCFKGSRGVAVATLFESFSESAKRIIMLAKDESKRLNHNFVGTEQILLGVMTEGMGIGAKVLGSVGINLEEARVEVEKITGRGIGFDVVPKIQFTRRAKHVFQLSRQVAWLLGDKYVGSEHLILGLLRQREGVAVRVLKNLGANITEIYDQVYRIVHDRNNYAGPKYTINIKSNMQPTLEEYATDLTKHAEEGKLDPVVGREPQIERIIQILCRRTKNNPCLVGEPGVGKTAIAEGLAQRIVSGHVPKTIECKKVIALDLGLLVAGTKYRGEFEERVKKLMEKIQKTDNLIIFIDEVHTLIGGGASTILKPVLARCELRCIGATTPDEYRKYIEDDPAMERRFQQVRVPEPSVDNCVQILRGLRGRYEIHHKLHFTDEALVAAAQLSHQYISDRLLPDKAIDLIDEAGSRVRLRHAQLQKEAKAKELDKELSLGKVHNCDLVFCHT